MSRLLHRLGRSAAQHPWRMIGLWLLAATVVVAALLTVAFGFGIGAGRAQAASSDSCADDLSAQGLTTYFTSDRALLHGDYQRVVALPDGRSLWTFQDAYVENNSGGSTLIHNAALLQTGRCFELLRGGTDDAPKPWLFADETTRFQHWFWPLGAEMTSDGNIGIFVVEMSERGAGYLQHSEPVKTWLATIDAEDMQVIDLQPAPAPSASLYGWSVTSDASWTYLYAYCYRQFGFDPLPFAPHSLAHDLECSADVRVARVSHGHLDDPPTYWNGSTWSADPSSAVPVVLGAGRSINPAEVHWDGDRFIAVTKAGDWWGDTIYVDVATTAHGPWRGVDTVEVAPVCDSCNTYFASFVPSTASGTGFVIGLSNNTWNGAHSTHYAPTFLTVEVAPDPQHRLENSATGGPPASGTDKPETASRDFSSSLLPTIDRWLDRLLRISMCDGLAGQPHSNRVAVSGEADLA